MPKSRLTLPRRHLLALCTFLVPLGALAWLQQNELRRQGDQVRGALQREASQFLIAAAQEIEHQFAQQLPQIASRATDLLTADQPDAGPALAAALARTTRALQDEQPAVRDLLLLDVRGGLRAPDVAGNRNQPPFARDAEPRETFGRGESSGYQALRAAELLIALARFGEAEGVLRAAIDKVDNGGGPGGGPGGRGGRRFGDGPDLEALLQFRLGTVLLKLGKKDEAVLRLQKVRDNVDARRELLRRGLDSDALDCGLLAELLLAEQEREPTARLALLSSITCGRRDAHDETTLRWVAERAAAAVPDAAPERAAVTDQLRELEIHLQARAFALDYDSYLDESIGLLLRNRSENAPGAATDAYKVFALNGRNSVLVLHPLFAAKGPATGWLGIHLDLGRLLAGSLDSYLSGNGSLVLAIADGDKNPVVKGPPAPADFVPATQTACTLELSAYPADVDGWLRDAAAAARASALLTLGLFGVALVGALLLWRSVSRESELATLKVDLVSRVSHELKTPLALISLYGETLGLKRARDADQAAQFGNIIAREAARLTGLIQRILDFSRQQAGTLRYEPKPHDLGELLAETAAAYAPHLEAKGASLATDLATGVCARVDGAALAGVVVNLFDNAIKYARDEEPDRSLRLELRAEGDRAVVDVLDRGRGVPASERERVFESFYRASNAGEVRGAGLGLSLVRHFTEAHGGTATVLPREGGGSIFRITLPITNREP